MTSTELIIKRVRRSYPKALKAQVVAECKQPGESIAGVALRHGINANLVHKWLRHQQSGLASPIPPFVPLVMSSEPMSKDEGDIRVELRRGDTSVMVRWPRTDSTACAAWLCEWLR